MGPDLDSLVTRLYVTVDDLLIRNPHWAPRRPAVGISPQVSDAEMVTLAVIQVLLRFDTEARFLRLRACSSATLVSVSARPVGLQQAAAPQRGAACNM